MSATLASFLLLAAAVGADQAANELRLPAKSLYELAIKRDVRWSDAGVIELDEGELVEDDGPAAGYSYKPNEEKLSDLVWIKKELVITDPTARKATLLVGSGGDLKARINGQPVELKSPGKAGNYWQAYSISPKVLKAGVNEIELGGAGRVWIAREEDFAAGSADPARLNPERSSRSTDGGKTWVRNRLGPAGDIAGEYYVRLFLDRYRPTGTVTLPIMDSGNLAGKPIAPAFDEPPSLRVQLDATEGAKIYIRSGWNLASDFQNWNGWQPITGDLTNRKFDGRFIQLQICLAASDRLRSPQVKGVRIEALTPLKSAEGKYKSIDIDNGRIVRSSIPFTYELYDHPKLTQLREKFDLDEFVKGTKTELELIERVARWSAGRWQQGHLKDLYPDWDALEILKPHADGKPIGGFCQQYNLVFLQACESLGIPGRAVSIGPADHAPTVRGSGHEVVELWSNQFRKWIFVDGNFAWYAVDPSTGVPYSLLELRGLQHKALQGAEPPIKIVHLNEGGKRWEGLKSFPSFGELRLIPRSNFLGEKWPIPLNQGMRGWFWTGHYAWTDRESPASLLYGNRVSDRDNWEWTLNQCQIYLQETKTPEELRVYLDTETPSFDAFMASIDGAAPKYVKPIFPWKLHRGKNELVVYSRNRAGRDGIPSRVLIERGE